MVTWKSKKHSIVVRSTVEIEYKAMTRTTCELIWIRNQLRELHLKFEDALIMFCDHIAKNLVYYEKSKHIEIDFYFVREFVIKGEASTPYIKSTKQLKDLFTKVVYEGILAYLCSKVDIVNIYVVQL